MPVLTALTLIPSGPISVAGPLGEAFDRAFGRGIGPKPRQAAGPRCDRRDIDNRAAASAVPGRKAQRRLFAGEDGRNHVDGEEPRQARWVLLVRLPCVYRGHLPA